MNDAARDRAANHRHEEAGWRLRWATLDDVDDLHALACLPKIYRYLFDGEAPPRTLIADRVEQALADADRWQVGLWLLEGRGLLEGPGVRLGGCVQISPDPASRSAELLYLLDPALWGQGLATRMAWTAITLAFRNAAIDSVFAGADGPNHASVAVMRRLNMIYARDACYPLGPGVEYAIHRGAPRPPDAPSLLPVSR